MKPKKVRAKVVIHPAKKLLTKAPKKVSTYEKNFHQWTKNQVDLLKNGDFESLDVINLVEEIASLGKSERYKLESHLMILLMHMLKVRYQPQKHTKSWDLSIKNSRHKANQVLKENPSLRPKLQELLKEAYFSARLDAAIETGLDEKTFPKTCPWSIDKVLSDKS